VTRRMGGLDPGAGQMCGGPQRCDVCGASYQATVEVHACPGKKHPYGGEFPGPCRRCKRSASHPVHFDPFPPANPVPVEPPDLTADDADRIALDLEREAAHWRGVAALLRPAATEQEG